MIHQEILARCSAGPWGLDLDLPPGSADGELIIVGDERDEPLARFDRDDAEAHPNSVVMAAGYELVENLGGLLLAIAESTLITKTVRESADLSARFDQAAALLQRLNRESQISSPL